MNSIERTAKFSLEPSDMLKGEVKEMRQGDRAAYERWRLRESKKDAEHIQPIEDVLSGSLSSFRVVKASILNRTQTDQPFGFQYAFESEKYAKTASNLLLVRPRVLESKAQSIMETKDARRFPVEFEDLVRDVDNFEIAMPAGYEVDELPPPVDSDYGFASYHSKTEVKAGAILYSRTFEVKELSVPVSKAEELTKFYRMGKSKTC
jgi:hypothetical protein